MDAGEFDAVKDLNRACQFALNGAVVVHFLNQGTDAKLFIVKNLVARLTATGHQAITS